MKLKKNRTCTGCKALHETRTFSYCELGYDTIFKTHPTWHTRSEHPTEICPKPKNIKDYLEARENFSNHK